MNCIIKHDKTNTKIWFLKLIYHKVVKIKVICWSRSGFHTSI